MQWFGETAERINTTEGLKFLRCENLYKIVLKLLY